MDERLGWNQPLRAHHNLIKKGFSRSTSCRHSAVIGEEERSYSAVQRSLFVGGGSGLSVSRVVPGDGSSSSSRRWLKETHITSTQESVMDSFQRTRATISREREKRHQQQCLVCSSALLLACDNS